MNQPNLSILLTGSPRERGIAHGTALRASIQTFLADGIARLNHVASVPHDSATLKPLLSVYAERIAASTPLLWQEIEGLAEGAGISRDEAVLLQCRRELMGYSRILSGDCTSLARSAPFAPVLAQTIDLTCEMQDQIQVLQLSGPDIAGGGARVLSFTGLLGYLGVNDAGLAVGLNLVLGGDWRPGLPPYLAIRHLIDHAHNVGEAITILRDLPLASSRNFMLCDDSRAVAVERLGDETRIIEGSSVAHANHFLDTEFANRDELNVFARNSSLRRLNAMRERASTLNPAADEETLFEIMSERPLNVQGPTDMRRERTVAAVVMLPHSGKLALRRGDPNQSATEQYEPLQTVRSI
ncbi:isopenicillin-N N-acyltransferase-like protein [Undibacterium sp. GrIS 1.2]